MLALRTFEGLALDLLPGSSVSLEQHNFLLADPTDNGSYTLPFTLPRSPANQQALDYPELLDHVRGPARTLAQVDLFDDSRHLVRGSLRLLRLTPNGYEVTLSYGASEVMARLKATRLRDLTLGGLRVWKRNGNYFQYLDELAQHMADVVASPASYDYVFAPYSNNEALADHPDDWPRYANFNNWGQVFTPVVGLHEGFRLSTGVQTGFPVLGVPLSPFPDFYPAYKYSCCPCVKLAYLVRTMLRELAIPLEEDFFDAETEQLVLLGDTLAEDGLIYSKATRAQAAQNGLSIVDFWFRLGDVLPDLTGAELLRQLADTFFLDVSVSPTGALRLRRSTPLLTQPPVLHLSRAAVPAPEVDVSADLPRVQTAYRSEHDDYASKRYQVVDPNQLGTPVATVASLPAPDVPHEVRLVLDEDVYYQHDGTKWVFYSEHLDAPALGLLSSETIVEAAQGCELVLETTCLPWYVLPSPGAAWLGLDPSQVNDPVQRIPIFGERAYAPGYNCIERSPALRLGFYRGRQPYQDATQGTYPMLSAGNRNLQNQLIGQYSLRLDGDAGTVAKFGSAVLELKTNPFTVTWPVWLSEEQFYQLDMARKVEIDGLHFAVRKVSLTFPLLQPAQLELVLMQPKVTI
jgi:hypothetical protein